MTQSNAAHLADLRGNPGQTALAAEKIVKFSVEIVSMKCRVNVERM
jgi:hypothetical protein